MISYHTMSHDLLQLKKTVGELNTAIEQKDEIAQRCHELDLQVGGLQNAVNICHVSVLTLCCVCTNTGQTHCTNTGCDGHLELQCQFVCQRFVVLILYHFSLY